MACLHYKKILFVHSELETHRGSLLSQVYNMLQAGNKQKSLFPKKYLKKDWFWGVTLDKPIICKTYHDDKNG